jgi:hypothetical protein
MSDKVTPNEAARQISVQRIVRAGDGEAGVDGDLVRTSRPVRTVWEKHRRSAFAFGT